MTISSFATVGGGAETAPTLVRRYVLVVTSAQSIAADIATPRENATPGSQTPLRFQWKLQSLAKTLASAS